MTKHESLSTDIKSSSWTTSIAPNLSHWLSATRGGKVALELPVNNRHAQTLRFAQRIGQTATCIIHVVVCPKRCRLTTVSPLPGLLVLLLLAFLKPTTFMLEAGFVWEKDESISLYNRLTPSQTPPLLALGVCLNISGDTVRRQCLAITRSYICSSAKARDHHIYSLPLPRWHPGHKTGRGSVARGGSRITL